jgi:aspartate oxidase
VTAPSRGYDLAVVGSGIAGLYAAIRAHEEGRRVLLVTKGSIDEASTRYAQGGIAAAVGHGDDAEAHLRDTIEAGAGLVDEEAARIMVTEAAARIADLVRSACASMRRAARWRWGGRRRTPRRASCTPAATPPGWRSSSRSRRSRGAPASPSSSTPSPSGC